MAAAREDLPEEIDALRAALLAERARAARVEAELAVGRGKASDDAGGFAHQRLEIEKLERAPAIADREADAPALRAAFGAHRPAAGSDGAGIRGTRKHGERGRDRRRA